MPATRSRRRRESSSTSSRPWRADWSGWSSTISGRHPARSPAAHLRPVLHHQGGGRRDRSGPLHHVRHRQGTRGLDRIGEGREHRRGHLRHRAASHDSGAVGASGGMSMARVLIVDDDLILLKALPEALLLRMEGVVVDTCDSAPSALREIAATDYDAIVVDIKMPGMDGLALLGEIRALRPETPTVLITGHGHDELAVRALRGGAYDFIQKPIEREYFVASLRRAIEARENRRHLHEQQEILARHASELERIVDERT